MLLYTYVPSVLYVPRGNTFIAALEFPDSTRNQALWPVEKTLGKLVKETSASKLSPLTTVSLVSWFQFGQERRTNNMLGQRRIQKTELAGFF